tara:strand:+ start:225 stop:440 length:216 start_codon:yes stop_codon:yes gene_type:complete
MAKKTVVKEKYAGRKGPMKVETPPPAKEIKLDEINSLGNKLADLSERVNEVELSVSTLTNQMRVVMGRMGL